MKYTFEEIRLTMQSLKDFESKELAELVLSTIWSYGKEFIPSLYGIYEPLTCKTSISNYDELVKLWLNADKNSLLTGCSFGQLLAESKGKKNVSYSVRWDKSNYFHFNSFSMTAGLSFLKNKDVFQRFIDICERLIILIEPVHGEIVNHSFPDSLSPKNLRIRLPELNAFVIFGEPYVKMFGKEKLLKTPCFKTKEIWENTIILQLVEDIFNPVDDFVRNRIKEYLGKECFVETGKTYRNYKDGKIPDFDFSDIIYDKNKTMLEYEIRKRDKL